MGVLKSCIFLIILVRFLEQTIYVHDMFYVSGCKKIFELLYYGSRKELCVCVCVQALHPVQLIQCISSVIMIQNLHIVIIV